MTFSMYHSHIVIEFFAFWVIFHALVVVCCLFFKINFFKKESNGLDSDQDRQNDSVGPDLGPNCLQMLSAEYKSRR